VDAAAAEAGSAGASSNDDDEAAGPAARGKEPGVCVVVECGDGSKDR
jgi:hypothetical protein